MSFSLYHLFCNCPYPRTFWDSFKLFLFSFTKERIHLTLSNVLVRVLTSSCSLLNKYSLLIARLYIWDRRRNQVPSDITTLKLEVKMKHDDIYIGRRDEKKKERKKWAGFLGSFYRLSLFILSELLPVPRLRGRLGQVRCRKASWGCFGGRSFQNGGRKHESSASWKRYSRCGVA